MTDPQYVGQTCPACIVCGDKPAPEKRHCPRCIEMIKRIKFESFGLNAQKPAHADR